MTVTMTFGNRRGGFALILVLILVGVAAVLGMSYLQSASVRRAGAENLVHAARSKYLAESGLQHAMYVLQTDLAAMQASSASAPLGPFYADAADPDPYYFYATACAGQPGEYVLTAEARSNGVTQRCTARVSRAAAAERTFEHAVTIEDASTVPASVSITGSVYIKDTVTNFAVVDGDVFSSATLTDPFLRITGTQLSDVEPRTISPIEPSDYAEYELHDEVHHWTVTDAMTRLEANDPLANGGAITTGNPAGVVKLVPANATSVELGTDLKFQGTLIVYGDLIVDGTGIHLTAVKGFPAMVVTGKLYLRGGAGITLDGFVYVVGGIHRDGATESYSTINGGVYCGLVGFNADLIGSHQVTEVNSRRTIFDFSENANLPTIEVLRWDQ